MKRSYQKLVGFTIIAATLGAVSSTALAANKRASSERVPSERFTEYAKVVNVRPVYHDVRIREPEQQCWMEPERYIVGYESDTQQRPSSRSTSNNAGNSIIGGLIGGVIGNQLGRGQSSQSRTGATVVGAIIGSALGNETNNQQFRNSRHRATEQSQSTPIYEIREVQRCKETIETRIESQLQHYNVTYLYKGRKFVTQLPRDPGKQLELQVSVAPARR